MEETYNLKNLNNSSEKFGIFNTSSAQREYFAYSLEKETPSSRWILTFVNQSNFGNNTLTSGEARQKSGEYIDYLETVFENVSQ